MKYGRYLGAAAAAAALFLGSIASAATYMVSNRNDSGLGSLRQAILDANSCDSSGAVIAFAIDGPGLGPHTIQPLSPLPPLTCIFSMVVDAYTQFDALTNSDFGGSSNANLQVILDGSACGSNCDGLVVQTNAVVRGFSIRSFSGAGIRVDSGSAAIRGNFIGTDPGGVAFFNGGYGVDVKGGFGQIGSMFSSVDKNVISSNGSGGVRVAGGGYAQIYSNLIGGGPGGGAGNGNSGAGVKVEADGAGADIYDNYIRYNTGAGVVALGGDVQASGGANHSNGGIGIDLNGDGATANDAGDVDVGPNTLLNYPTILSFTPCPLCDGKPVTAELKTDFPNHPVRFDFYSNSTYGADKREGEIYLGSVGGNTDAAGYVQLTKFVSVSAANISVTASIDECFEDCFITSEFSPMFVQPDPPLVGIAFEPTSILTGGTSNLVVVVKNPNSTPLNNVGYSVTPPGGLTAVAWTPRADCPPITPPSGASLAKAGRSANFFVAPDGPTIYVSDMDLAAGQTCTIDFTVSADGPGTYTQAAGTINVSSNEAATVTNTTSATLTVADPAPAVLLTPTSHAFATQTVGTTSAPKVVTLKNSGTATLLISNIVLTGDFNYAGCGFPMSLDPGASCTFSITFTPGVAGPHTGSIAIHTNAAGSPHSISLSGDATSATFPSVVASPASVSFGAVITGTAVSQTVTITNRGSAPLEILGVDTTGVAFAATNRCPATLGPGFSCEIVVTFTASPDGTHSGALRLTSNAGSLSVPLSGEAMPLPPASLSVTGSIDFGQVVVGTEAERTLELRNTGSRPLVIERVSVGAPFSVVETCGTIAPGATCTLRLRFAPTAFAAFGGIVEIVSNSVGGLARVELLGEGVRIATPRLEISVDGLGFGNQGVGSQSAPQTITLHSVGALPVELRGFALATPDFVVDSSRCPAVLAVDARCEVSVVFRPFAAGPRHGRLTILSTMPGEPPALSLTGTGCRFFSMGAGRNPRRLCSP